MTGVRLVQILLLLKLCAVLFLPGTFVLPPFDRDEARFAQATRQMVESRDFIDIRFQEEARHKKPIGIYWLQAAAVEAVGLGESSPIWVYRLPSIIGATLAVLLTAWVGGRLFGSGTGVLAAAMLAGCVVMGVEARMAKTDAVLLALIIAAQGALAQIYLDRDNPRKPWRMPMLFWAAQGAAILIKGPIGPMISFGTIFGLMMVDWRLGWLRRLRPILGLLLLLAIVLPWLIAIGVRTDGAFFIESLGRDLLGKVASGQESKGFPPGFYIATFWGTFAPFSFLTLLSLPWIWSTRRDPATRFCLAWIIPAWLVFEFIPTKLFHYTLPVFPALALLTARAVLDSFGRGGSWRRRRALGWLAGGLGIISVGGVAGGVAALPWFLEQRIEPAPIAAASVLLISVCVGLWLIRRGAPIRAVSMILIAFSVFSIATYQFVLPNLDDVWISRRAAQIVARESRCPTPVVASAGYGEPSLVFLLGTKTRTGSGGVAAEMLKSDPKCGLAFVSKEEEAVFREALGGQETQTLGMIEGVNYSRGKKVQLNLYAMKADPK
ncbi:4-amino-4-deoxy-L-arabinose transferase [Azospirillaceae bacterium]